MVIVTTIGVSIAIWQVRELRRSIQANTHQILNERLLELDKLFVENPELASFWGEKNTRYYRSNETKEQTQKRWMMITALVFYQNLYF